MGKLYDRLQDQLKSEEHKKDAEECLKIYEKLKEMNNGSVWSSQWQQLVDVRFKGFPSDDRTYKPSELGYVFLKGIEEKKELIQQCLSDIINEAERVTTGNVSHHVVSIKAMAAYCLRIINGEI